MEIENEMEINNEIEMKTNDYDDIENGTDTSIKNKK